MLAARWWQKVKVLVLAKNNALLAKTICYPYSVMLVVIAVGPAVSQTFHSHCSLWAHINNLFSDRFLYYLQHFSEAEDGFVWLSEDYPQFLQTRRRICIWTTAKSSYMKRKARHTSHCDNCLKDGVTCSKLTCSLCNFYRPDCGDCNKKALVDWPDSMAENGTLPPELTCPCYVSARCCAYRIYSKKRRGACIFFRVSGAALIRGRRLFSFKSRTTKTKHFDCTNSFTSWVFSLSRTKEHKD